jgi:hypothetical protein
MEDLPMERYQLLYFFKDLIELSIKYPGDPGFGIACSELLQAMMLRQDSFINKILKDDSTDRHMFHEYRLNGAGLKMHWKVKRTTGADFDTFQCYISGDQVKQYADFYVQAKEYIRKRGYNHR